MADQLTLAVINDKLDEIRSISMIAAKTVLDAKEAALFLGLKISTIYRKTSSNDLPYYKQGQKVYFRKDELERWMLKDKRRSNDEIMQEATTRVALKKIKGC
ncbi:MAG: helix-turn-helix domain-containing protein [Porphyromonadaceae bacterium]|nr:helix-turn-helix domain-containing protein [Porphyromonadaceae bacterium]